MQHAVCVKVQSTRRESSASPDDCGVCDCARAAVDASAAPQTRRRSVSYLHPLALTTNINTAADLEQFAFDCLAAVAPHVEGYVWQRDAFALTPSAQRPPPWDAASGKAPRRAAAADGNGSAPASSGSASSSSSAGASPPCLWGVVSFGDAVDDEWFVVWLLLELTRQFAGAAARVWDDDGEFLLIEAAYSLPRWLKPEVGAGRVWLHAGRAHVVPLPSARHPSLPPAPTPAEALAIVRCDGVDTLLPR